MKRDNLITEKAGPSDFYSWLIDNNADRIEKYLSAGILLLEFGLLFFEKILPADLSTAIFLSLNFIFILFAYLSFSRYKFAKRIFAFNKTFSVKPGYQTSFKNYYNSDEEDTNEIRNEYANHGLEQFRIIRFSWLSTAALYAVFIAQHYLRGSQAFNDINHPYHFIKPFLTSLVSLLTLIGAYYYLIVYNVMYRVTILKSVNKITNKVILQNNHLKSANLFLVLAFMIFAAYGIFYYVSIYSVKTIPIRFEKTQIFSDSLKIFQNEIEFEGHTKFIKKHDGRAFLLWTPYSKRHVSDLTIVIYSSNKDEIIIVDTIHHSFKVKYFERISERKNRIVEANIKLIATNISNSTEMTIDPNIKNIEMVLGKTKDGISSVDFGFQCLVGIITALTMCFFVGRFESLTFKTPVWILLILYLYSVIQGFLPFLDSGFMEGNSYLQSVSQTIQKLILLFALLGKVVLYLYIQSTYSTKRLFYYFIETREEKEGIENHWENSLPFIEEVKTGLS